MAAGLATRVLAAWRVFAVVENGNGQSRVNDF